MILKLRNPHSAIMALESRPGDFEKLIVPPSAGDAWKKLAALAEKRGISVFDAPLESGGPGKGPKGRNKGHSKGKGRDRERHKRERGGRESAAEAWIKPKRPLELEEIFGSPDKKGLWIALDHVQDPHNVGAIFRTAAFFGVKGIILTEDRSAPLSATAYDVASGGLECVPFSTQANLTQALKAAKRADLWILGSSEHAETPLSEVKPDRKWLLVLGNEEKGARRLTLENCDLVCKIPRTGKVDSLNVSVAGGILISALSGS